MDSENSNEKGKERLRGEKPPSMASNSWRFLSFLLFGLCLAFLFLGGLWTWFAPSWTRGYNGLLMAHLVVGIGSTAAFVYYLFKHLNRIAAERDRILPFWMLLDFGIFFLALIYLEDLGRFPFSLIPMALLGHALYCIGRFSVNQFRKKSVKMLVFGFLSVFLFLASGFSGMVNWFGNIPDPAFIQNAHRLISLLFVLATALHLLLFARDKKSVDPQWMAHLKNRWAALAAAGAALLAVVYFLPQLFVAPKSELFDWERTLQPVENPLRGTKIELASKNYPSLDLMANSKLCGDEAGCHSDGLIEWESSAHRYGANRMVRSLIQQAMDEEGETTARFCIGCHAPASAVVNLIDKDYFNQTDPAILEGSNCVVCHRVSAADASGNSSFAVEPPFGWIQSGGVKGRYRYINVNLIHIKPDFHNRVFRKDDPLFDSSEYCAACHEVYLNGPEGRLQLHNVYQSWKEWREKTGKTEECIDCHMPYVEDHVGNMIPSHRFPGANQALDILTEDWAGLTRAAKITVMPGVRSNGRYPTPSAMEQARLNEEFLRGEMEVRKVWRDRKGRHEKLVLKKGPVLEMAIEAPAEALNGEKIVVKVVTKNVKSGHSFPTGTLHTLQAWLDFEAQGAGGKAIYRSGALDENGFLEPEAHRLGSRYADAAGEPILDGRIWRAQTKIFYRVIPPAGEIVDEFAFSVPPDAAGPLKVRAKWRFRKASQYLTNATFGEDLAVSLPITDVAEAQAKIEMRAD